MFGVHEYVYGGLPPDAAAEMLVQFPEQIEALPDALTERGKLPEDP